MTLLVYRYNVNEDPQKDNGKSTVNQNCQPFARVGKEFLLFAGELRNGWWLTHPLPSDST